MLIWRSGHLKNLIFFLLLDLHFESPLVVPGGDEGEGHRGIARAGVYLEEMDVPKAWSIIFSAGSVPILVVKKILYIV